MKAINLAVAISGLVTAIAAVSTASAAENGATTSAQPQTAPAAPARRAPAPQWNQNQPPMMQPRYPAYGMAPQGMPYGMNPYGAPQYGAPQHRAPQGMNPYGPPMGYAPPQFNGPNGYRAPSMNPSFNPPSMEPPWGNDSNFDMSPMKFWPVPGTGNPWHYKPWEPGAPWGDSGKFSDPPDEAFHEAEDFLADAPRMPRGWELPNISMPSPFEIGEQVGDQSWLLPENFKMRDRKRPSRYRKYFQNEN